MVAWNLLWHFSKSYLWENRFEVRFANTAVSLEWKCTENYSHKILFFEIATTSRKAETALGGNQSECKVQEFQHFAAHALKKECSLRGVKEEFSLINRLVHYLCNLWVKLEIVSCSPQLGSFSSNPNKMYVLRKKRRRKWEIYARPEKRVFFCCSLLVKCIHKE